MLQLRFFEPPSCRLPLFLAVKPRQTDNAIAVASFHSPLRQRDIYGAERRELTTEMSARGG
jgi:hypothetical protein